VIFIFEKMKVDEFFGLYGVPELMAIPEMG
jgi:hypothetical protein